MTAEQMPTLPPMRGDGQTLLPEQLAGQVVTVLDSQVVVRRDGSTAHKWLVRHGDGTLGLYWAPGYAPPQQVHQFFREHPKAELRLLVTRSEGEYGARWQVQQMQPPAGEARGGDGRGDDAVDQVPF